MVCCDEISVPLTSDRTTQVPNFHLAVHYQEGQDNVVGQVQRLGPEEDGLAIEPVGEEPYYRVGKELRRHLHEDHHANPQAGIGFRDGECQPAPGNDQDPGRRSSIQAGGPQRPKASIAEGRQETLRNGAQAVGSFWLLRPSTHPSSMRESLRGGNSFGALRPGRRLPRVRWHRRQGMSHFNTGGPR